MVSLTSQLDVSYVQYIAIIYYSDSNGISVYCFHLGVYIVIKLIPTSKLTKETKNIKVAARSESFINVFFFTEATVYQIEACDM